MAILLPTTSIFSSTFLASILLLFNLSTSTANPVGNHHHLVEEGVVPESDFALLEFPLNLEYLEAEFFLWGSLGYGLDVVDPSLAAGGAPPVGARKALLDPLTQDIVHQFGIQEVGHLRAIKKTLKKAFARPLLNLSAPAFAKVFDSAFEHRLFPPFDPYATSLNYLLASYVIPYVGLTGYVGANPKLQSTQAKKLVAGLLAVESGQDAVIRALLYEQRWERVMPYRFTVEEFTNKISDLRNKLGKDGVKDEGLSVHSRNKEEQGRSIHGNVLAGDENSLGYPRTPEEILRIVYGSGNESFPGGFYPLGADGKIAKSYYDSNGNKHK